MRILEWEQLAKEEDTVGLVLEEISDDIKILEDYTKKLKDNQLNNGEANKTAQSKLNGAYNNLRTALAVVGTAKRNRELKFYYQEKEEVETSGKKFNSTATKEKAMALTNEWRRVRNYLESQCEEIDKTLITLQSILKDIYKEQTRHTE